MTENLQYKFWFVKIFEVDPEQIIHPEKEWCSCCGQIIDPYLVKTIEQFHVGSRDVKALFEEMGYPFDEEKWPERNGI